MLSIGHTILEIINGKTNLAEVVASLSPDILRASGLARTVTHFTGVIQDSKNCSWIKFPATWEQLKAFTKSTKVLEQFQMPLKPCVIDEETNIALYEKMNAGAEPVLFEAYRNHLVEDSLFDIFIRELIDCTNKYDDKFVYDGNEMDGKALRALIADVEQMSVYILAGKLYDKTGVLYTNEWLKENIKPALDNVFSPEMADSAFSFMKIRDDYNEKIKAADFNFESLDKKVYEALLEFHSKVLE